MTASERATVLIVEDEPDVAETYRRWLESSYEIKQAPDGPTALEMIDETIDVVLLDRMMPEMSGAEVLAEIRKRNLDCRVAMVTAVDPDFDIIEMGFDEYVSKPPDKATLSETIERLLDRGSLNDDLQQYYSLVARQSTLQTEKTEQELAESEEYADLSDRIAAQRAVVDDDLGDMESDTAFVGAVREIMAEDGPTDHPRPEEEP